MIYNLSTISYCLLQAHCRPHIVSIASCRPTAARKWSLMSPAGPLKATFPGGDGLGDVPPLALAGVRSAPAPRLQLGCKERK